MQKDNSLDKLSRICLVISSLSGGGAERVLAGMANYWAERGKKIYIITFSEKNEKPFYALNKVIKYKPLSMKAESSSVWGSIRNNWLRIKTLRCAIADTSPDVVISFMDNMNVLCLLASRGLGIPVIVSERIDPSMHNIGKIWSVLRRVTYLFATKIVTQTRHAAQYFKGALSGKVVIIPNAVKISITGTRKKNINTTPIVLGVGRLVKQKGFDLLIEAFSIAKKEHPEWKLIIIGKGTELEELYKIAKRLHIDNDVHFPGEIQNIDEWFVKSDLFVLSSRYEGFPNVLAEAMARELAVISFDCPSGPAELIDNGTNGILVPKEDSKALAFALCNLMGNLELRKKMGKNARNVLEEYSEDVVMDNWNLLLIQTCDVG